MAVTPRPYHHGNLRAALLESAEQTLNEGGELSLRELARQVGVSHAAPRRHFAGKQALLDALAEDGFERLGNDLRGSLAAAGPSFDARLLAFGRAYVRFATEHAALLDLMFAGKHRPGAADSLRAGRRPRLRGAAVADRRGPGRRRGRRRRSPRTSAPSPSPRSRASPRSPTPACSSRTTAPWRAAVERLVLGLRPR